LFFSPFFRRFSLRRRATKKRSAGDRTAFDLKDAEVFTEEKQREAELYYVQQLL
jgi:hypothetical protein